MIAALSFTNQLLIYLSICKTLVRIRYAQEVLRSRILTLVRLELLSRKTHIETIEQSFMALITIQRDLALRTH